MSATKYFTIAGLLVSSISSAAWADDLEKKVSTLGGFPGTKSAIEIPIKGFISGSSSALSSQLRSLAPVQPGAQPPGLAALPGVAPRMAKLSGQPSTDGIRAGRVPAGLVAWYRDIASASRRSKISGKPVLVFQMLGNLDDEFC